MARLMLLLGGWLSVALGFIGVLLPVVPTVPFLIVASYCFARSSPRFHNWLHTHPRFGRVIADWEKDGVIRRPVKLLATVLISVSFSSAVVVFTDYPLVLLGMGAVLLSALVFVVSRPESPRGTGPSSSDLQ